MAVEAHACLQPQRIARTKPARPNAELRARFEQGFPHLHGRWLVGRNVDLESVFARIAGARDQHIGNARPGAPREPIVLDCSQVNFGQLAQGLQRARTLQRQLRVIAGIVADVDRWKTADLHANPGVVFIFRSRIHYQHVVVRAEPVDEDVVNESARGHQECGIVRLAVLQL